MIEPEPIPFVGDADAATKIWDAFNIQPEPAFSHNVSSLRLQAPGSGTWEVRPVWLDDLEDLTLCWLPTERDEASRHVTASPS